MGSLVLAEPEISLFGRKTVQRLTMAFHSHPLLTLSVLLLFSILAVSAETRTMTCSRRWNNPDIDHKDDFALNDGRQITVNATTIINTNGADFERWYQPEISNRKNKRTGKKEKQIMYRIRIPLDAVTLTRVGTRPNPEAEECYIDYHGPSAHNFKQGSVGTVWCKNCLNDGRSTDTTNVIANDLWNQVQQTEFLDRAVLGLLGRRLRADNDVRTALTAKLRQLTEDRRYPALPRPTRRGQ